MFFNQIKKVTSQQPPRRLSLLPFQTYPPRPEQFQTQDHTPTSHHINKHCSPTLPTRHYANRLFTPTTKTNQKS